MNGRIRMRENSELKSWRWQAGVLALVLGAVLFTGGCATMKKPQPIEDAGWLGQAYSQTQNSVTVWIALPDDEQTKNHFGLPLQDKHVQPLWLRVDNRSARTYWLLPAFTDPAYYSAAEVTQRFCGWLTSAAAERRQFVRVDEVAFDHYIPPASDQSGFIYTVQDDGSQVYSIALLSTGSLLKFSFLVPTERLRVDHRQLAAAGRVAESELPSGTAGALTNLDDLRRGLEALPAQTSGAAAQGAGDPVNFFIVAQWDTLFPALITAGWDETEVLDTASALRTTGAFLFGAPYRHSPVSPLFVFGQHQDAAFQKIRENINARNHLRLWLLPIRFGGIPVWAGQISRDIGVRFTTRTPSLTTHRIDPDVDGARWSLVQDLIKAQCVAQIGFVEGGIRATPLAPRRNLTGDTYFTDGLRVVLFLSATPVGADEIEIHFWSFPPHGGLSQPGDYLKPFESDPAAQ